MSVDDVVADNSHRTPVFNFDRHAAEYRENESPAVDEVGECVSPRRAAFDRPGQVARGNSVATQEVPAGWNCPAADPFGSPKAVLKNTNG
jgi:hypothetical protein